MNIIYSKTGSDGNLSYITDGSTNIIIDCGISFNKANKDCSYKLLQTSALIVTHAHQDHIAYLNDFISKGINVYAGVETWNTSQISHAYERYKNVIEYSKQFQVGTFIVKPFLLSHFNTDGTECENYGFLFFSTVTKEKMLWITDCAYIGNTFPTCNYICVECNYIDVEDYSNELDYTNIPVEKRRLRSHLSLRRCISFLRNQDLSKVKEIRLLHLTKSQGNIKEEILERMKNEFPNIKVIL